MDQAAKPVVIAASLLLAASLITLGVKAGSSDGGEPVGGDGPVAAGSETAPDTAAPDATETDTTAAPDATETDSAAPDATETDGAAPDATETDGAAPDDAATDDDGAAPDDGASGDSDSGQTDTPDLDDMPDTGGGTAIMLGGLVAVGSAVGLRRRR